VYVFFPAKSIVCKQRHCDVLNANLSDRPLPDMLVEKHPAHMWEGIKLIIEFRGSFMIASFQSRKKS
jgi:hypothetical protein